MRKLAIAVLLVAVVAVAVILFQAWDPRETGAPPEPLEVSPEAAVVAEEKLARLHGGEEVRLSEVELSSLLRYRPHAWALQALEEPEVRLAGDTIRLSGRLASQHLPQAPELAMLGPFLPDTAAVELAGRVRSLPGGEVALEVLALEVARLPIPQRLFPALLERMGRVSRPGLAAHAIVLPLPPGIGSARLELGHLVLTP